MLDHGGMHNFVLMTGAHYHNVSMHIQCCQLIQLLVTVIFKVEGALDLCSCKLFPKLFELFSGTSRGAASIHTFCYRIDPSHRQLSKYCLLRKTIEDFHTVHLNPRHQFYGVFDGHLGNLASKYAASSFYHEVEECLSNVDSNIESSQANWKEDATSKLVQSFQELHNGIINAVTSSPGGVMDESGTTATILYVTELAVIIANVGDSRAIMSQWLIDAKGSERMTAMQLTVDHVASSTKEQMQILERGGFVSEAGGIDRVNGSLAVSRSLGDIKLAPFLSRTPDVFALTKEEANEKCGKFQSVAEQSLHCFIILASDGLWDVMSNQEAVDLAWQVIKGNKSGTAFQEAAEVLTQEAYVRGSSDNIGVCVVAIM